MTGNVRLRILLQACSFAAVFKAADDLIWEKIARTDVINITVESVKD